jgi:hypothetical protein
MPEDVPSRDDFLSALTFFPSGQHIDRKAVTKSTSHNLHLRNQPLWGTSTESVAFLRVREAAPSAARPMHPATFGSDRMVSGGPSDRLPSARGDSMLTAAGSSA